jgi:LuxR family transcriptional regulator of csgAB operon
MAPPLDSHTSTEFASVFIIGDNELQNQLLSAYINQEMGIQCVACESVEDALWTMRMRRLHQPAILMMDHRLLDYGRALQELRNDKGFQAGRLIIAIFNFAVDDNYNHSTSEMHDTVHGLFYRDDSPDIVMKSLRAILKGNKWISRKACWKRMQLGISNDGSAAAAIKPLTKREQEVLFASAAGLSNRDIAEDLCVSLNTVKSHLYRTYKKLNIQNRTQAALWVARHS